MRLSERMRLNGRLFRFFAHENSLFFFLEVQKTTFAKLSKITQLPSPEM